MLKVSGESSRERSLLSHWELGRFILCSLELGKNNIRGGTAPRARKQPLSSANSASSSTAVHLNWRYYVVVPTTTVGGGGEVAAEERA